MKTIIAYTIAFSLVFLTAIIPSPFMKSIHTQWYQCVRTNITPPNYVFPIVWTILYIFLGTILGQILLLPNTKDRTTIIYLFIINLILNIAWSYFYFYKKYQEIAYFILITLISTTLGIIYYGHKLLPIETFYMIIPYYLWTCFALVLSTVSLNKKCVG